MGTDPHDRWNNSTAHMQQLFTQIREKLRVVARRGSAIAAIFIVLWVAAGSAVFPEWWYRLFWNGGIIDQKYIGEGWQDFVSNDWMLLVGDRQPWYYLCGAIILICILVYFRKQLLAYIDRWALQIIFLCGVGVLVVSGVLQRSQSKRVEAFNSLERITSALSALYTIERWTPALIEAPIDFRYLDGPRVSSMYGQMQSEFIEKQRTTSTERTAEATIGIGGSKVEAGGKLASTSSFQKQEPAAERQCIELINSLLSTRKVPYYTTAIDWRQHEFEYLNRALAINSSKTVADLISAEMAVLATSNPGTKDATERLRQLSGTVQQAAPQREDKKDIQGLKRQVDLSMQNELNHLGGLVVLEEVFNRMEGPNGSQSFEAIFSESPIKIAFRFSLQTRQQSEPIKDGLRLRVFGNVIHPLNKGEYIEVFPIAIF